MLKRPWLNRSSLLLAVALFMGVAAKAQEPPPLNGIAHVALRVGDLAASRTFYTKLGFEEAFALSRDGAVYESFIKINDRQFLELYPVSAKDPQIGFLHLCFEGADLEAISKDYVSRGLTLRTTLRKAGAGNLLFTMDGPAQPSGAQNIEYTQYLPGSLHSNDVGKHLGKDRIADRLVRVSLAMNDPAAAQEFYVKQLRFTPSTQDPTLLDLPGTSGEQIQIVTAEQLGQRARVSLHVVDLRQARRMLGVQKIAVKESKGVLTITDPDGNTLLLEAR